MEGCWHTHCNISQCWSQAQKSHQNLYNNTVWPSQLLLWNKKDGNHFIITLINMVSTVTLLPYYDHQGSTFEEASSKYGTKITVSIFMLLQIKIKKSWVQSFSLFLSQLIHRGMMLRLWGRMLKVLSLLGTYCFFLWVVLYCPVLSWCNKHFQ